VFVLDDFVVVQSNADNQRADKCCVGEEGVRPSNPFAIDLDPVSWCQTIAHQHLRRPRHLRPCIGEPWRGKGNPVYRTRRKKRVSRRKEKRTTQISCHEQTAPERRENNVRIPRWF
jgi:hypothetical protein